MTPERYLTHRRGEVELCKCGRTPATLAHVLWSCPLHGKQRDTALRHLPAPISSYPMCFQSCGIVTNAMGITEQAVKGVHLGLVQVIQAHVADWQSTEQHQRTQHPAEAETEPQQPQPEQPGLRGTEALNGHRLAMTNSGQYFCVRCGKSTQYAHHVQLKITSVQCRNANNPPELWVSEPGAHTSKARHAAALEKLAEYNRKPQHDLLWNSQGRQEAGRGRLWRIVLQEMLSDLRMASESSKPTANNGRTS